MVCNIPDWWNLHGWAEFRWWFMMAVQVYISYSATLLASSMTSPGKIETRCLPWFLQMSKFKTAFLFFFFFAAFQQGFSLLSPKTNCMWSGDYWCSFGSYIKCCYLIPVRSQQAHTCGWLNPPGVQRANLQHPGYRHNCSWTPAGKGSCTSCTACLLHKQDCTHCVARMIIVK